MINLNEVLAGVHTAAIAGHVRPDGDCVGSCLGLYNYIRENYPDIVVHVYMEEFPETFSFLSGAQEVRHSIVEENLQYDVFFILDSGDEDRIGVAGSLYKQASKTVCIDHHISNQGYADQNYIVPGASSTSELIFELCNEADISKKTAEAIYTGMVHDTGVFKFSNTSERTLQIAGKLISRGIPFSQIIEETFEQKTYVQNQILGRALLESILFMDGKCIFSVVREKDMRFYNVTSKDLSGIVNQLMITKGVECAIFMYETAPAQYKVSLRSTERVDVSKVACYFGGGGHKKAAGCMMHGTVQDVINNLSRHIERELNAKEA